MIYTQQSHELECSEAPSSWVGYIKMWLLFSCQHWYIFLQNLWPVDKNRTECTNKPRYRRLRKHEMDSYVMPSPSMKEIINDTDPRGFRSRYTKSRLKNKYMCLYTCEDTAVHRRFWVPAWWLPWNHLSACRSVISFFRAWQREVFSQLKKGVTCQELLAVRPPGMMTAEVKWWLWIMESRENTSYKKTYSELYAKEVWAYFFHLFCSFIPPKKRKTCDGRSNKEVCNRLWEALWPLWVEPKKSKRVTAHLQILGGFKSM